ncbi:MAG: hypothetical protein JW841_05635 [Deltaproteobacteria bacterium]|nr:hypothetical protein [Deltaproteobacteria bacterium]
MPSLSSILSWQPHLAGVFESIVLSQRRHHAYLLVGVDFNTTEDIAHSFTASLFCQQRNGIDACGVCLACRKLATKNHPDFINITPNDKNVITIDQVREIGGWVNMRAYEAPMKIIIISAADAATAQAQNALLKTLEEPPGAICFLLTVTRIKSLLPTVRSRCAILRIAAKDRLSAWQDLVAAGINPDLAQVFAPIIGANIERANELIDLGAQEVLANLHKALSPTAEISVVISMAAAIGQQRERADLALAFIEVLIRDSLANKRGARNDQLYIDKKETQILTMAPPLLAKAAAKIALLRRLLAFHLNRTLVMESVFRDLGAGLAGNA